MSNTFRCTCGQVWKMIPLSGSGGGDPGGGWERGRSFAMGAPPPGAEYSRETPTGRVDNLEGGLRLPLGQAAITGVVAFLLTSVATWYWYWPWSTPPVAAVVVGALAWLYLLQDSRRLLRTSETVTADPEAGDPGFSVEIIENLPERKRVQYAHFPARQAEVERFAMAMINGHTTVNSHHRLSRRKFTQLRDVALDRGLLAWRCEDARQQGVIVTTVGVHVFKRLIAGA